MEFQNVRPSDESIVMFAKIAVNQGRSPGLEKGAFYDAIVKRAAAGEREFARGDKSGAPCGEYGSGAWVNLVRSGREERAFIIGRALDWSPDLSFGENERRCCRSRVFVGGWI